MPIGQFYDALFTTGPAANLCRRRTLRQSARHYRSPRTCWSFSPIVRSGENGLLIGGFGRPRRLSLEPGNEPGARRTRRRIRPVDRLQTIGIALVLGDIEPDEPPSFDIFAHHRLGHVAPADAFLQQHVLRAKIGQAPSVSPDHAVVLALCDWRAVGQHKLDVVARGAWRIPARERQRMIGSSDGISSTLPTPMRSISGTCA